MIFDETLLLGSPPEELLQNQYAEIMDKKDSVEKDYYSILNIPADVCNTLETAHSCSLKATIEDIKAAYRRLSMVFHPDKHTNEADKSAAETQFHLINNAYNGWMVLYLANFFACSPKRPDAAIHLRHAWI